MLCSRKSIPTLRKENVAQGLLRSRPDARDHVLHHGKCFNHRKVFERKTLKALWGVFPTSKHHIYIHKAVDRAYKTPTEPT